MPSIFTSKKIFAFIAVLAFFAVLNFFGKGVVKNFFYKASASLQSFVSSKGEEVSFSMKNQEELNKKLIEENDKLMSQLADLESVKQENEFLRNAFGLTENKAYEFILADITAKNSFSFGKNLYVDSVLINKGKNDGIRKGFPVVISDKIIIGKISEVYDDFSVINLVSSKDNITDVEIDGVYAVLKGEGNLKASLDLYPKDQELKQGSLVLTSALGGIFPPGFVLGEVEEVSNVDSDVYRGGKIKLAFDLSVIKKVLVLKGTEIIND